MASGSIIYDSNVESTPTRRPRRGKIVDYAESSDDDEQQPIRPSRILRTTRLTKAVHHNYDANAAHSPLLKLPPELRNRILKLVLGGRTIHIFTETRTVKTSRAPPLHSDDEYEPEESESKRSAKKSQHVRKSKGARKSSASSGDSSSTIIPFSWEDGKVVMGENRAKRRPLQLCRSICLTHTKDEEYMEKIKAQPEELRRRDHGRWSDRHRACYRALQETTHDTSYRNGPFLNLSILAVCRQLHAEAALLPYADNTFTFTHFSDLQRFLTVLVPKQLRAVQHINMSYAYRQSDNTQPTMDAKLVSAFRKPNLPNEPKTPNDLKTLNILLSSDGDWSFDWERVKICADLMQFKKLSIESINVYPYMTDDHLLKFNFFTLSQFEGWAKDLQDELEKDWKVKDKGLLEGMREVARKKFGFFEQWT
ncbi:hypothetical protein PRZ48_000141 [Zasmidium cellare]|uniref:DUF7730 domain-containing protein n=1 Tax=Zasmidium cellare TaxID=395010 RepID=A0ABR0EZ25_ZASCE|nr:hypothetical protein PRZ48_000141 [Zasmidium cellare]